MGLAFDKKSASLSIKIIEKEAVCSLIYLKYL